MRRRRGISFDGVHIVNPQWVYDSFSFAQLCDTSRYRCEKPGDQEVKLTEAGGDEKVADEKGYASESSIDLDAPAQQAALPAQQAQYHYHELERVRPVTTTL